MKAVIIKEYGGIDKLLYTDIEKPVAGEGEYLINIKAAGVNPVDAKAREGYLKERIPNIFPVIPGWDFAGVIVERGHSARRFTVGDEVYGYARRTTYQKGTYAEYITLPESYVAKKPSGLSFEDAASVPLVALTAYQSLFDSGNIKKSQDVLIIGASGGVGSFAMQYAKITGARVIAVASSNRESYLKSLGARHIIDYSKGSFKAELKRILPEGVDLVFDCAGNESTIEAYACLKENGILVSILSHEDPDLVEKYKINFKYVFVEPNVSELDIISKWFEEKKLKINLQKVYDLKDVSDAHTQIETRHTQGKIVLRIS